MRRQRSVPFTGLAAVVTTALVTAVVACGGGNGASPARARTALSGEEAFRGLMFQEGDVAALFPELGRGLTPPKLTPEQQEERARLRAKVVADMRQADATFFDRFGADVQSGEHVRIQQAMHEGAVLLKRVLPKRAPDAPPAGVGGMCYDNNTNVENTVMANTSVGNSDYGNTSVGNWAWNNTDVGNTAFGNSDVENLVGGNNDVANEAYSEDTLNDNENSWAGTQLGHDQLVEMISTRLAAK